MLWCGLRGAAGLALLTLAGLVSAALDPPALAAQQVQLGEGTFGFVNADGTELLALDSLDAPARLRVAVCAHARVFRVGYARRQARAAADNGRQIAANFVNQPGDVFRIQGGRASVDETCYLSTDSALVATAESVGEPATTECDATLLRRMAVAKRRAVLHCWPLADASDAQIVAVQFGFADTSALASVVVVDRGRLLFDDFPATYRGPDSDIWRADDGGVFSPEAFTVLFVCRLRGAYVMALTWAGAEGEDADLLVADSADAFRRVATAYRYWVPT